MLLWGSAWSSAKVLSSYAPPELLIFWRFLITTISILPILWYFRGQEKRQKGSKKDWLIIVIGSLMAGVAQWFLFSGLKYGYPGIASVIFTSASPLFTFLLSLIFLNTKISKLEVFALFLGMFGVLIIFRIWEFGDYKFLFTDLYFLVASFSFALSTIINQKAGGHISPILYSLISSVACVLIFVIPAFTYGIFKVFYFDHIFWANIIFYGGVAGGVGTTLFFVLAHKIGSNKASSYILTVPVFGVAFGYALFDEPLTISLLVGGTISIIAVTLINFKKRGVHGQTAWRNELDS